MKASTEQHEPDRGAPQDVPRWAATAGRESLTRRLAAWLFCSLRRLRTAHTHGLRVDASDVPWSLRERVLRDYHAVNLAHARCGSEELVRAGYNTGPVPYGYRASRVRVVPRSQRPRWRTRLVIEPVEAAVVKMIFMWRGVEQLSCTEIVRRLTDARYPAPLNLATGQEGVWTAATVRAILRNEKYAGLQVWGRRHHGRPAPRARWVWSATWAHPPLITIEEFAAANRYSGPVAVTRPDNDDSPPLNGRRPG